MKLLYIALISTLTVACQKPPEPVQGPRTALVMTIADNAINHNMTLVGEVKARYESAQGFRVAGKIIERKVEIGSLVKKGQVLARLDKTDATLNTKANDADVISAEAQLTLAKANLERQRQLRAKNFVSAATLDSYEAQLKTAQARVDQTKAITSVSGNQSSYTSLIADRDGVITEIRAEPGQVVSTGEVIAKIADLNQLEVHIPVPETRISQVKVGDSAEIRLWAHREQSYEARIREIAPAADAATRSFLVKVSLLKRDDNVHLGMTAGVRLSNETTTGVKIPNTAVTEINHQASVWLVNSENKTVPQAVTVEAYREDGALISSGLKVGDKLVIAGLQKLVNGELVRPYEARVPQ